MVSTSVKKIHIIPNSQMLGRGSIRCLQISSKTKETASLMNNQKVAQYMYRLISVMVLTTIKVTCDKYSASLDHLPEHYTRWMHSLFSFTPFPTCAPMKQIFCGIAAAADQEIPVLYLKLGLVMLGLLVRWGQS